ncbi:hypothetical protein [Cellulosilyticum ruminicola]|uniref:hypothetical protein n=1 Tax=Cellulosilyticum ruminicola TaxID=425254 RepID=UPI0006D295CF|nr:hypothetical protein [Cellulosilyticum ruminicola]
MDQFSRSYMSLTTFDKIYNTNIRPKLEAIDTFLKTTPAPYNIDEVANLFEISPHSITQIMTEHNLTTLDRTSIFMLICHLPHDICHLIKRQWQYQNASYYTSEMIAHIYKLNIHKVTSAFEELRISVAHEEDLIEIFKRIHISIFKF